MATVEQQSFFFPDPPEPDQIEWPGTPIGEANILTKTKARTLVSDKAIDAKPGRYEELLGSVTRYMASAWTLEPAEALPERRPADRSSMAA